MAHRHERGAREAVTAAVGERGRRTGAVMPRHGDIPLTQDGFEDPDAFFKSPAAATASQRGRNGLHMSPSAGPSNGRTQSQPQHLPSSASKRHQRRPDVTHEIGVRGRKTGMPIAPNGRIARTSDGMEDMDAFFAGNPASIPPLQRAKRYSQILEEEEEYDDVYEAEDQTANYGKRGRGSNATARGVASVEDEEYDDDENKVVQDDEREQSYEESDYSRSNVTGVSSLHRGRRQSVRSDAYNDEASVMERDQYDIYAEDDGGTRTMSLEGSSFFNKSNRTIDAIPPTYPSKSRLSTRSDIYGTVPSPSNLRRSSPSTSGTPRQARYAVASTSKQGLQALQDATSSDDENEAIQSSLTRSAQARRRRSSVQSGINNGQTSSSPSFDRKGKGRQSLFAPPTSEQNERSYANTTVRIEDEDDDYGNDDQVGFEPAAYDDEGRYPELQQENDDYPDEGNLYRSGERQGLSAREQSSTSRQEERYDDDNRNYDREEEEEQQSSEDERQEEYIAQAGEYEDEDSDNVSDELPPPLTTKGKQRDRAAANDSGHIEDQDEDRNGRIAQRQQKQPIQRPRKKYQKRVVEYPDGVRRSRRDRTSPVAFWRNEHVIYQRIDSPSGAAYYEKVGIADRPKPPVKSLVNKHKRSRSVSQGPNQRAKTRSVSVATDNEDEGPGQGMDQDWAKWDQETDPDGIVWDYVDGKEMQRRVAFTSTMLDPKATKHGYRFQRVFTDGEFLGAGLLVIPPGEKKPLKPAKDNTYVLFCHQGAVRVLVHRTEFSVAKGGFFLIPRGNSYQINNLTDIDAVLVFMQAKEVEAIMEAEDGED